MHIQKIQLQIHMNGFADFKKRRLDDFVQTRKMVLLKWEFPKTIVFDA